MEYNPEQRLKLLNVQLDAMVFGINCTHEQYLNLCTDRSALEIAIEIDEQIIQEILSEAGIID